MLNQKKVTGLIMKKLKNLFYFGTGLSLLISLNISTNLMEKKFEK